MLKSLPAGSTLLVTCLCLVDDDCSQTMQQSGGRRFRSATSSIGLRLI